jgi:hypothetical protein
LTHRERFRLEVVLQHFRDIGLDRAFDRRRPCVVDAIETGEKAGIVQE